MPKPLTSYKPFWPRRFGPAPFLPMSREEMDALGWDSCDVIIVTGDAYVDHPSFGMAVIGRVLHAQGFRVGIIAQPDWHGAEAFRALGKPNLFWGVTAGNMDSMINRYTADRKIRSDDAYTPGNVGGQRPDRAAIVYSQRCREAYKDVPIILGGIEGSLRRIAHYDYWSDTVRRSIVLDSKCDLLLYGNAERALLEVAHRLARREPVAQITDVRGTAFVRRADDESARGWMEIDSTEVDLPGRVEERINPYQPVAQRVEFAPLSPRGKRACPREGGGVGGEGAAAVEKTTPVLRSPSPQPSPTRGEGAGHTVIRLPAYDQVKRDPVLYAHASRVLHLETNPGNARALVQAHGSGATARDVWINPPPIPLTTAEMDWIYGLPYARGPHPRYADARGRHDGATKIPAWEMIRFSINIMRGCFGGCTFCSITEHEGRIIQSRSEASIVEEIEAVRDRTAGFTGVISDLGGPTANMYRLACKSRAIEAACRKPSCVWPGICGNLVTDHAPLIALYRRARALPGIKKVLIGSGLRYDLAVRSPEYVRELATHHVGGYLKIAPEHTEDGPLAKMMKPGIATYDRFKALFDQASQAAGKAQFLIPYFIAAHPGTTDEDMLNLALWLKANGLRADQVQAFYPSPMATATAMYHTGLNPLKGIHRDERAETVETAKGERRRRLHKAFLRWHDPANWPLLRDALKRLGRADLIGNGKRHLIPAWQPATESGYNSARRKNATPPEKSARKGRILTQHTGLPPRRQA
jgi:uncharacterized radical SAM protein YgiQ